MLRSITVIRRLFRVNCQTASSSYSNRYISVVGIKDRKIAWWRDYLDPLRVFAALEGRPFEPDGAEANRLAASLAPSVCVEPGPAGR